MWFTPTSFQGAYHLDVGQAGALLGPIHLVAGVAASLLTAWILSRPAFADPRDKSCCCSRVSPALRPFLRSSSTGPTPSSSHG